MPRLSALVFFFFALDDPTTATHNPLNEYNYRYIYIYYYQYLKFSLFYLFHFHFHLSEGTQAIIEKKMNKEIKTHTYFFFMCLINICSISLQFEGKKN